MVSYAGITVTIYGSKMNVLMSIIEHNNTD